MGEMEANVYMATILPGYYVQSLGALTELRRSLGRDWILGSGHDDGGEEKGVKLVLDVGTGGAGVLAWHAMVDAVRQLRQGEANEIKEPTTPTAGWGGWLAYYMAVKHATAGLYAIPSSVNKHAHVPVSCRHVRAEVRNPPISISPNTPHNHLPISNAR